MNHQPYDTWILDELQISPQEQDSLNQHMKECPECFELQRSWNSVHTQLRNAPVKSAPAGFMRRWKTEFADRLKEQERRQARTLLISLGSGAVAVMIALAVILVPDFSVISITVGFFTTIVKLFSGIESLWSIVSSIVASAPTITLIISGLLIAGWISLASFAWGISLWRISTKKVKSK